MTVDNFADTCMPEALSGCNLDGIKQFILNDINVDEKFEKHMYALFDTMIDPDSRRYLSEDYTFCRLWQQMGGEVFLDPRTGLNHVGHYTFRGNIRKLITG